jgi:hypothetical protein
MKELFQPVLDLIKMLVQPEKGTKFLVTVAGLAAIYFMHVKTIDNSTSDIVIGVIVAAYYVADIFYKTKINNNEVKP